MRLENILRPEVRHWLMQLREELPEQEIPVPQRLRKPHIDFAKAKVKQQLRKSIELEA